MLLRTQTGWGQYAERSIELSTFFDKVLADSLLQGASELRYSEPQTALRLADSVVGMSIPAGYYRGAVLALLEKAYILRDERALTESMETLRRALPYSVSAARTDPDLTPRLYNALGGAYMLTGYYDSGIQYALLGFSSYLRRGLRDSVLLGGMYANMSAAMLGTRDLDRFSWYTGKAFNLATATRDTGLLTVVYGNLSTAWKVAGQPDSSIRYAALNAVLFRMQGDLANAQTALCDIAGVWLQEGDFSKAQKYLDSATRMYPEGLQHNTILRQRLGRMYHLQGRYRDALPHYMAALKLNQNGGGRPLNLNVYRNLAEIYAALDDHRQAYRWSAAYSSLWDSIYNENITRINREAEVKYRLIEKNQELLQQQRQLDMNKTLLRQKNIWISVIASGSLLLLLFLGFAYRIRQKLQQQSVRNAERSRIARDLHDGMGALLSAIKMNYILMGKMHRLAGSEEFRDGMALIDDMRDELRGIAYNLISDSAAHRDLGDAVSMLCRKFEKSSEGICIHVQTLGDLEIGDQDLYAGLYRMMEEIIHNSLKHSGGTEILVQLIQYDDLIRITVEDNGRGFDPARQQGGMGLRNLRERARQYKVQLQIFSSAAQGTSIELEVPYKKE